GQAYAVGEFVHQDQVARLQRGQHRPRWDAKRLHHERTQYEHEQDHRKKADSVFHPPWHARRRGGGGLAHALGFLRVGGVGGVYAGGSRLRQLGATPPQHGHVQRPDNAGYHQQHKKYECEVPAHLRRPFLLLVFDLQDGQEGFLRDLDTADLLHALLAGLLFFEQFFLAGDIAPITFGKHVLAQRLDVFARNDLGADGRLDGHVEHRAGNEAAHAGNHVAATLARVGPVHDHGQGVDPVAIDEQVNLHHIGRPVFHELIIHGSVAARYRLEPVEEIQHDLGQRNFVCQVHLAAVIAHVDLHAALVVAQRHHGPDVFLGHEQGDLDDGLADIVDLAHFRHARRAVDDFDGAIALLDFVHDRRRGGDNVHVELALQALLHNFHVQQAQEPATETEAQRLRHLGLEHQRGVVELELFE